MFLLPRKVVIMGAAGRDFHNFNVYFKDREEFQVVAFTATQIPSIENRIYPPELAGRLYPDGIPIYPEEELESIIRKYGVNEVVFAYSDVSHEYVMHRASRALAAGASFTILGPTDTMLKSKRPVISICAVRTGSGKSPLSRWIVSRLREKGVKVVVIRHPMPYGDLKKQSIQRFENLDDLDKYECTIEEREEYEPHLERGAIIYSGIDMKKILEEAEKEAELIIWEGGNNDLPFIKPDIHIVVVDPHRPGHELRYHPGEANVRMADIIVISKVNTADSKDLRIVEENVKKLNSKAKILKIGLKVFLAQNVKLEGKKVLVIEDGPTLTHGEMKYGAATLKCLEEGAEIIDPRPYVKGPLKEVYKKYKHIGKVLPAIGYKKDQIKELEDVINKVPCDCVVSATPTDLSKYLHINKPIYRVRYEVEEVTKGELEREIIETVLNLLH